MDPKLGVRGYPQAAFTVEILTGSGLVSSFGWSEKATWRMLQWPEPLTRTLSPSTSRRFGKPVSSTFAGRRGEFCTVMHFVILLLNGENRVVLLH